MVSGGSWACLDWTQQHAQQVAMLVTKRIKLMTTSPRLTFLDFIHDFASYTSASYSFEAAEALCPGEL